MHVHVKFKSENLMYHFFLAECRVGFGSKPTNVNALIDLIKSKDIKVSRHAALALSNACELGKKISLVEGNDVPSSYLQT